MARTPVAVGMALLLVGALGACSSDESGSSTVGLAAGCSINSECTEPLVCAFRKCHTACESSRDCPSGERCMASDRPFHVCQLPEEAKCSYNSECPAGQLCGADGQCRDQCASDRDCVSGQLCVTGVCAEPGETDGGRLIHGDAGSDSAVGQACAYTSQCTAPLVCRGGVCAVECLADVDCPHGWACSAGACVVVEPDASAEPDAATDGPSPDVSTSDASAEVGPACAYDSECSGHGIVCRGGACVCECKLDVDCAPAQKCDGCACAYAAPDGAPDGYGSACNLPSDCPSPLICGLAGRCVWQCSSDFDCGGGQCCVSHACATGLACSVLDAGTEGGPDGQAPDGATVCVANAECDDDNWCNGYERCVGGLCLPAVDTPCDSHSACMQDQCDEATKSCKHTVIASQDGDGDGHLAYACGGDDCDDSDATTYTGAPEACDGIDNDCDGVIDNHSRRPHGPVALSTTTGNNAVGAPLGAGWVHFYGLNVGYADLEIQAQLLDATGASQGTPVQLAKHANNGNIVTRYAAGEPSSALVVYDNLPDVSPAVRYALVVDTTLAVKSSVTLAPGGQPGLDVDATWNGAEYAVAWTSNAGAGKYQSNLGLIKNDGSVDGGFIVVPGVDTGFVRVAASGSTVAVVHQPTGQPVSVHIYGASLNPIAGPIAIPNATSMLAVGGTSSGYVLLWTDGSVASATYVSSTGTLGATTPLPLSLVPLAARGGSDGTGAGFLLRYADGARFAYARGALASGVELTTVPLVVTPNPSDMLDFGAHGAHMSGLYYAAAEHTARQIAFGCP